MERSRMRWTEEMARAMYQSGDLDSITAPHRKGPAAPSSQQPGASFSKVATTMKFLSRHLTLCGDTGGAFPYTEDAATQHILIIDVSLGGRAGSGKPAHGDPGGRL